MSKEKAGLGLEDLPRELLLNIINYLPTISLIALLYVHPRFTNFFTDTQFLNRWTRHVLGFSASERDITYESVLPPAAPLQDLWFQSYLHHAAPYMAGLVTPEVVFYNLVCFKHLLDTWILQGLDYKYRMFVSDVLKGERPPPLHIHHCKRLILSSTMMKMVTKVALCQPQFLLLTVNNFERLAICKSFLTKMDLPEEFRIDFSPENTFEVVSCQRGFRQASIFFTLNSQSCVSWSGLIDYSTFRWKDTWGLCKFPVNAPLPVIHEKSCSLFEKFLQYVGQDFISICCSEAFMIRGLRRLIQNSKPLIHQLQTLLEKTAIKVHRKLQKTLLPELCAKAKNFVDSVTFLEKEDGASSEMHPKKQHSRTLEVALQRYLHRYLNHMIGWQVLPLYRDRQCHHMLCVTCHNSNAFNSPPPAHCMKQVDDQPIPLKIWPPHLLQQGLVTVPALAKLVCLDIELWRRLLLDQPLPSKVVLFVKETLSSVYLDFSLDSSSPGIIAKRIFM